MHTKYGDKMYYINYFFIFSIFGHFLESNFFSKSGSGILTSYWTPVYGIGSISILLIHKILDKYINHKNKILKIVILFFTCSFVLATLEAIGGYLIKWIFNTELWNYENHMFNIGRYTSLEMALVWGICGVLVIYIIKPLIDKIIYKIPKWVSITLSFLFILDIIVTIISKLTI